jgi:hypothetical protein
VPSPRSTDVKPPGVQFISLQTEPASLRFALSRLSPLRMARANRLERIPNLTNWLRRMMMREPDAEAL